MSKVIVLVGSVRRDGNTELLAKSFADGVGRDHEVELISVADYHIHPCIGCNHCYTNENNYCVKNDDMEKIYEKLMQADTVVIASPVYFYGISAQLKTMIDRLHTPMRNRFPIKQLGLILVGAGCGGADWLTIKAWKCLAWCDTLLYDELVAPGILELAPAQAEQIAVGKRGGSASTRQEDICRLMIEKARQGRRVVRLKGGDPFLFGRGGEEALALREAGIPYQIVPGISSAIAIPEEAGIPVTHREVSRSLHIVTAHTTERDLPEDLSQLAALDGTLVFLMGGRVLGRLAKALMENGKDPETPTALISGGNSASSYTVRGTIRDIAEKAKAVDRKAPAVIVVGSVAGMDVRCPENIDSRQIVRVGLAGTETFRNKLEKILTGYGIECITVLKGICNDLPTRLPWDELKAGGERWILFTSRQGIHAFFRMLQKEKQDIRNLAGCRFGVIGKATKEALLSHGICADYCPDVYTGKALGEGLTRRVTAGAKMYLMDSAQGTGEAAKILRAAGICCSRFPLYDTKYEYCGKAAGRLSGILLGSAGAVRALAQNGVSFDENTVTCCIGPISGEAFKKHFNREPLIPKEISAEAIADLFFSKIRVKAFKSES